MSVRVHKNLISNKALAKALAKRKQTETKSFSVSDFLFKEQLAFIEDPASTKVAMCSRRSGKTVACAADLMNTALKNPGVVCLYITLSRNNAKKIIWRELKKINRDYNLGAEENLSELSMTLPNNSIIYLSGAKDTNEIEKFRGLAIKLVYIDEAQSFREYIRELINDVLAPALMDYAGTLVLIGTPPPIPTGYFCEAFNTNSPGWSKHHWTFWNNPFVVQKSKLSHQQMLDRELARRGVTADDPSIQREWFGKIVLDSDSLLIHYNPEVNHFTALPDRRKWNYILGIDLGFDDADAVAVLAWSETEPTTYIVEEIVVPQQGITELVNQIEKLKAKYDISKMVIDQGGLGKKIAEEIRRRYLIPVEPADKAQKMGNISIMNDALRTGKLMANKGSKFAQDSYLVEIDKDRSTPDRIVVSDKYHSDIIDAVLYAFKCSPAYSYQAPKIKPIEGTPEYYKQITEDLFENALEHFTKQNEEN